MKRSATAMGLTRLAGLAMVWSVSAPALAQVSPPAGGGAARAESELHAITEQLDKARQRATALARERRQLASEARAISARLVVLAREVMAREALASSSERRIAELAKQRARLEEQLKGDRQAMARLLAALQRIERTPPPPLLARPDDAVAALRGASIFSAMVNNLRQRSNQLVRRLARLENVRARLDQEGADLAGELVRLENARKALNELHGRKMALIASSDAHLAAERARARALADKARTVNELIAALRKQAAERARLAAIERERARARAEAEADNQRREKARQEVKRFRPGVAFVRMRGKLPFPASGRRIRNFGDADGFSGTVKGVMIATRKSAQVVTPADGVIEFAGKFRSYGKLVILNVGGGYRMLLAGLDKVMTQTGQRLKAGEPVGRMGDKAVAGTLIGGDLEQSAPILYIELRKNGKAVNPSPWWAEQRRQAQN